MMINSSVIQYFLGADVVVKFVMLILLLASFISWVFIFQRWFFLRWTRKQNHLFEAEFWESENLVELYREVAAQENPSGIESIFCAGYKEFSRLRAQTQITHQAIIKGVKRAMRIAYVREVDSLEMHLPFLATVGSTSPYVGLFGTVWGIMMAFQALGHVQQATIAMVAPGISEALIATAMGLFAAIPAVIAYNRYNNTVERMLNNYEVFIEEFSNYLLRFLQ